VSTTEHFFAPCPRGLEHVLALELKGLNADRIVEVNGGVGFVGPYAQCYKVNLESRIASRVLWRIGEARYRDEKDLYDSVRKLAWPRMFDVHRSIRVNVSAIRSPLTSLDFATLRVKDAVCDKFRQATRSRPDVDTRNPDVRIHVFLTENDATFYLDTSGEALFQRGYRAMTGGAPLKENLAAGILALSGWSPSIPLLDPMCGSGTILTEAAMIATKMAPGANRRFGFEKLKSFDRNVWQTLRDSAKHRQKDLSEVRIFGTDRYENALKMARVNLAELGMDHLVELRKTDVRDLSAPAPGGIIVTNPPYGVRTDEQEGLASFYPELGDALKKKFSGWTAYIFTADMRLPKLMRLSASKRTPLFNGALDCRLFEYKLVSGSNRKDAPRDRTSEQPG
jgi:putative N6-adenine-specific DNA methylase